LHPFLLTKPTEASLKQVTEKWAVFKKQGTSGLPEVTDNIDAGDKAACVR
jgi:hypothetical protein